MCSEYRPAKSSVCWLVWLWCLPLSQSSCGHSRTSVVSVVPLSVLYYIVYTLVIINNVRILMRQSLNVKIKAIIIICQSWKIKEEF